MQLHDIVLLLAAYLLGAIPFSVIISRWFYKTDVRQHGSGNPGATNMLRAIGPWAALIVLIFDMGKGALAVLLGKYLYDWTGWDVEEQMAIAGGLSILGHIFSPFLQFKGGKGVATTVGVIVALHPVFALIIIGVFLLVLLITRFVSLASMTAAVVYAFLIFVYRYESLILIIFALAVMALILIKHQTNIKRLVNQEENKFTLKKQSN